MREKGFTIIEILVVLSIMAVVGLIFTDVLVQTLRGQQKVKLVNQVKQGGQTVLWELTNEIRQAKTIVCFNDENPLTDTIVLLKPGKVTFNTGSIGSNSDEDSFVRFRYYAPAFATGIAGITTPHNGLIAVDFPKLTDLTNAANTSEFCVLGQTNPQVMTNYNSTTGVSIQFEPGFNDLLPTRGHPAIFRVSRQSGYNDLVAIKFRAHHGISIAGNVYEASLGTEGVQFTTTVQVRGSF